MKFSSTIILELGCKASGSADRNAFDASRGFRDNNSTPKRTRGLQGYEREGLHPLPQRMPQVRQSVPEEGKPALSWIYR